MKIGIITFHASLNCGSMLQAYGLQYTLGKHGINSEIIDFSNYGQRKMYAILYKPTSIKECMRLILNVVFYPLLYKEKKDFMQFSELYLRLGEKQYFTNKELVETNNYYDAFVAGSDQVWNVRCRDTDKAYFLNFVKNKPRYAYAVSMGATDINDLDKTEKNIYSALIKKFTAISVREFNAKLWIEELTGIIPDIMPDPTLLVPVSQWRQLAESRFVNEKFVFWYCMNYTSRECDAVMRFAKKRGLSVYVIDGREWTRRSLYLKGVKYAKVSGPSSFLAMIRDATYVITSSFHGTVFSTLFEKKFIYMKSGINNSKDDRAHFLLDQLALSNQLMSIEKVRSYEGDIVIDYSVARKQLQLLRNAADSWIEQNILMEE